LAAINDHAATFLPQSNGSGYPRRPSSLGRLLEVVIIVGFLSPAIIRYCQQSCHPDQGEGALD
jgi:hypothetical protein